MTSGKNLIYLHGLGSSPESPKARLVAAHFGGLGYRVQVPDLNLPSFDKLSPLTIVETVLAMIKKLPNENTVLVGNSFGGLIAYNALSQLSEHGKPPIHRLVLLAPALFPWHEKKGLLTPEMEAAWRARGIFELPTLASVDPVPVHYIFVEELRILDQLRSAPSVPTLVVHGTLDEKVSHEQSIQFADAYAGVKLKLLEDNHDLLKDPAMLLSMMEEFIDSK